MQAHNAKSPSPAAPGLVPLDSGTGLVLAELQGMSERIDVLERLMRTQHAPTANHHLLMALEESMLSRLKMMSDTMTMMFGKTAGYLQQMATPSEDDSAAMMEAFAGLHAAISEPGMAGPQQPMAPKGSKRRTSKTRRQ